MFSGLIINWYLSHKRELPWRNTKNAYEIWISEIILQQTRVAQGIGYYASFLKAFPTVKDLARASEDAVLLQWQGWGYYSRARNMHAAAKEIVERFHGKFPATYEEIRSLKGVGDYTAAAISSFAYDLPYAVLDGNVFRILSRYFEVDTPIDSTNGKKEFARLAREVLDESRSALHNQAMMDLGATVCLPNQPKCEICPVESSCASHASGSERFYPCKGKKVEIKDRYFLYVNIRCGNTVFLHRRGAKDIWQGLYEFPLVELSHALDEGCRVDDVIGVLSSEFSSIMLKKIHPPIKHVLSHQRIHAWFVEAEGDLIKKSDSSYNPVHIGEIQNYAVSRLTEIYLQRFFE